MPEPDEHRLYSAQYFEDFLNSYPNRALTRERLSRMILIVSQEVLDLFGLTRELAVGALANVWCIEVVLRDARDPRPYVYFSS